MILDTFCLLQAANFVPFDAPTDALLDVVDDNVYESYFLQPNEDG